MPKQKLLFICLAVVLIISAIAVPVVLAQDDTRDSSTGIKPPMVVTENKAITEEEHKSG